MIIQIAGTSGSGKSHLMKTILDYAFTHDDVDPVYVKGRDAPMGYLFEPCGHKTFIPGHYDAPTGGCDTIHEVKQVFDLILEQVQKGRNVLFEGLFVMNMTRGPALVEEAGVPFHILQLTTPLATCLASVDKRRAEKGKGKLESPKNTQDNYRRATNYCSVMRDAGARIHKVSREEALQKVYDLLETSDVG